MTFSWWYILLAAIAGSAMAVQGTLNSLLGKIVGLLESTLIVHLIGTATVVVLLFFLQLGRGSLAAYQQAPWYAYLGGILNVLIIFGVVFSIPKLGVGNATTAIVTLQLLTAVMIDHFGLFGMEKSACRWWDLVGIALMGGAAKILLR